MLHMSNSQDLGSGAETCTVMSAPGVRVPPVKINPTSSPTPVLNVPHCPVKIFDWQKNCSPTSAPSSCTKSSFRVDVPSYPTDISGANPSGPSVITSGSVAELVVKLSVGSRVLFMITEGSTGAELAKVALAAKAKPKPMIRTNIFFIRPLRLMRTRSCALLSPLSSAAAKNFKCFIFRLIVDRETPCRRRIHPSPARTFAYCTISFAFVRE